MERTNQIFLFNGSPITFSNGDSVVVNATEMAKPFGKLVGDWTRLKSTTEFLTALSTDMQIPISALIQSVKGGNAEQGTWLHEDVALEFARWLSPAFAIWCNRRIKELLTTGVTTTRDDDEAIAYAMNVLSKRLEESKAKVQQLELTNEKQAEELKEAAPKVIYHDEVLNSKSTYTTTQIAKEFGWGAKTLNEKLHRMGVQYKQNDQWLLYSRYADRGYTKTVTYTYTTPDGQQSNQSTQWTEKGRQFIHSLLTPNTVAV